MFNSIYCTSDSQILVQKEFQAQKQRLLIQEFLLAMQTQEYDNITWFRDHIILWEQKVDYFVIILAKSDNNQAFLFEFIIHIFQHLETYSICNVNDIIKNDYLVFQIINQLTQNGYPNFQESNILHKLIPMATNFGSSVESIINFIVPKTQNSPSTTRYVLNNDKIDLQYDYSCNYRNKNIVYILNKQLITIAERVHLIQSEDGIVKSACLVGNISAQTEVSASPQCNIDIRNMSNVRLYENISSVQFNNSQKLVFVPKDGVQNICQYSSCLQKQSLPITFRVFQNLDNQGYDYKITYNISEMKKSDVFGTPKLSQLKIKIYLANYQVVSNTSSNGTVSLNYTDRQQLLLWQISESQKQGEITVKFTESISKLPYTICSYKIENYSLSGVYVKDMQFINAQNKVQTLWVSDVEKVQVEVI
ncbi:Adaptor complexes medium subunit family protein [Spironucleus salmonicida]|uniref:Adaptor complexes medium subunit family protein n=1 Tax=Spironucleus salmonicida TaxID=348837 RepID=V6LLX2_9EUKA|nr:Adaptor complexes medium subunit family protein [Spironucleus salmonicida]|eukprot:EST45682.1 Adaptor complexes medium subunit family protein [Spironucleus salmonicida]